MVMVTIDMKATGANIRAYIKNNKMRIPREQHARVRTLQPERLSRSLQLPFLSLRPVRH